MILIDNFIIYWPLGGILGNSLKIYNLHLNIPDS